MEPGIGDGDKTPKRWELGGRRNGETGARLRGERREQVMVKVMGKKRRADSGDEI